MFLHRGPELITRLANKPQTSVSMKHLVGIGRQVLKVGAVNPTGIPVARKLDDRNLDMGAMLDYSRLLHSELPIRFAHRVQDLDKLPYDVGQMPSIQNVANWYKESLFEIVEIDEIQTESDHQRLVQVLSNIFGRHENTMIEVAKGLNEFLKSEYGERALLENNTNTLADLRLLHEFLDRFFMSRIGIRILIDHFLELQGDQRDGYVGIIHEAVSPAKLAQTAADDAQYMCERHYGMSPEVELLGRTDLTFPYVPSHLYYILFELLKNSLRAVTEHCIDHNIDQLPEIRVVVADGEDNEDVVIKISDKGGGIPRSVTNRMFSYLFTTANPVTAIDESALSDFGRENPLAGLGYGLPIARTYAQYFGGDLNLISMEGYGTDVFVHLSRLMDKEEPLT